MSKLIEIKDGGFIFTLRVPDDAQVEKFTRATLAQKARAPVTGPLKVTCTRAQSARVRQVTGAPQVQATLRGGPARTRTLAEKADYYRAEIKVLTARKIELTPSFEARDAARNHLRSTLTGVNPLKDHSARVLCLAQHDRLLAASVEHGRAYREYQEVIGMIKTLTAEAERLEAKVAA